jgi:outer membrane protein TolC
LSFHALFRFFSFFSALPARRISAWKRGGLRFFTAALLFCAIVPEAAVASSDSAPSGVLPNGALSLADCIDIALASHPSVGEAQSLSREQRARLESLKANDRVTVNSGLSYGYSDGSDRDYENSYSASLSGSKMIYDGGRNRLAKSAQGIAIRQAGEGEAGTRLSVVGGVKRAYYALLLARKNLDVTQIQLQNLTAHLERARGYYEVGSRPRIDIAKAEADVANARVAELKAKAGVDVAREGLLVAMGRVDLEPFDLSTPLDAPESGAESGPDAARMLETAFANRPDYRRSVLAAEAARIRVQSAARADAPTLSANVGGNYSGSDFPLRDAFNAGLRVDFPLYDAGERGAQIEIARAQSAQAESSLEGLRQKIVYEVRSCVLDLENARSRIRAAEESLSYARENLDLARGRYDTGVGGPLEVSDAVSDFSQTLFSHYQALYDAQTAAAALEEATGGVAP